MYNFLVPVEKRTFNSKERRRLAAQGAAMPDGSFPIVTRQDLLNAIQSVGRASDYQAARRHIITRARFLGLTDLLPEDWKGSKKANDPWSGSFSPIIK